MLAPSDQLNLSRFFSTFVMPLSVSHRKCVLGAEKWTSVSPHFSAQPAMTRFSLSKSGRVATPLVDGAACSWVTGATLMSAAVGVEGEEGAALPVLSPRLHR